MRRADLTGQKFGRLTVVRLASTGRHKVWLCRCDCGGEKEVRGENLRAGHTVSCGCFRRERTAELNYGHGDNRRELRARLNVVWNSMRQRCSDPRHKSFANYGGRGITVCTEWNDYAVFKAWALANGYRDDLTLDRKDNDGDYEPSNCRWATNTAQANNKRNVRLFEHEGQQLSVTQLSRATGVPVTALRHRLLVQNLTVAQALAKSGVAV